MEENPKFNRQPTRLSGYDYSLPGHYFVTICTADKQKTLSAILVGEGFSPPEVRLSKIGKIAEEQILKISERFPLVTVEKYVIMPNHLHLLIYIDSEVVRYEEDSMGGARSRTAVLGPSAALTTRCVVIHYRLARFAILPYAV